MLETRNAGMDNFTVLYKKANADQKLRDRYEYQMSVRLEENSRLRAAEDRGKEAQAKESAVRLYKRGTDPVDIADIVGYKTNTVKRWLGLMPV